MTKPIALSETEAAERAAFAEIGVLGEREFERVRCWIASGCEGQQPRPDEEARRVLNDRLAAAIEAREAAARAVGGQVGSASADARPGGEIAAKPLQALGWRLVEPMSA